MQLVSVPNSQGWKFETSKSAKSKGVNSIQTLLQTRLAVIIDTALPGVEMNVDASIHWLDTLISPAAWIFAGIC